MRLSLDEHTICFIVSGQKAYFIENPDKAFFLIITLSLNSTLVYNSIADTKFIYKKHLSVIPITVFPTIITD